MEWLSKINVEGFVFNDKKDELSEELIQWRKLRQRSMNLGTDLFLATWEHQCNINHILTHAIDSLKKENQQFALKIEEKTVLKYGPL